MAMLQVAVATNSRQVLKPVLSILKGFTVKDTLLEFALIAAKRLAVADELRELEEFGPAGGFSVESPEGRCCSDR